MATKVKTVEVCGRRTNVGSPDSWWVDTGIFVTNTNSLTITAKDPSAIIIWAGISGFGPAGDVNNIPNRDWPETLANRTGIVSGDDECWFGSLIGKVGRDGEAFSIGESRTLTPPATGTLFLAYNDGANFQDNSGSWEVDVTFEELVSLDPSGSNDYGTLKIYADRIETSLVDTWGVILTVEEDVTDDWDAVAIDNVEDALTVVRTRIQSETGQTFKEVFAGTEFRLADLAGAGLVSNLNPNFVRFGDETLSNPGPTRPDNRDWGRINASPSLDYYPSSIGYGFFNGNDRGIQNTIIHELGHIIANRTHEANATESMYDVGGAGTLQLQVVKDLSSPNTDSSDDIGTFWENVDDEHGEYVPDNFLNWVRDSYVGIEGSIDTFPSSGTTEQKVASAYWTGTTYSGATSPGIEGFTSDAKSYADGSNALSLLRSLGLGESDPNCDF